MKIDNVYEALASVQSLKEFCYDRIALGIGKPGPGPADRAFMALLRFEDVLVDVASSARDVEPITPSQRSKSAQGA